MKKKLKPGDRVRHVVEAIVIEVDERSGDLLVQDVYFDPKGQRVAGSRAVR
jgi:hypothetical protein